MNRSFILMIISCFGMSLISAQQLDNTILDQMIGADWKGELTYLDYSSGNRVGIPVNLTVEKIKERHYKLLYQYPNEPNANSSSTIKVNKDFTQFGNRTITSVEELAYGVTKITATRKGKDNGKKATLYYTYHIGPNKLSIEKSVSYGEDLDPFFRNGYVFEKQ